MLPVPGVSSTHPDFHGTGVLLVSGLKPVHDRCGDHTGPRSAAQPRNAWYCRGMNLTAAAHEIDEAFTQQGAPEGPTCVIASRKREDGQIVLSHSHETGVEECPVAGRTF